MMERTCLKCGHVNTQATGLATEACPHCRAVYKQVQAAIASRRATRSIQVLNGIVTGILADGKLEDTEILMLRTWLDENRDVASFWPGSAIAEELDEVLQDGVIDDAERARLMETLKQVCNTDFATTGSVSAEVSAIPFDEDVVVDVRDRVVCLTGEFTYGSRKVCEQFIIGTGGHTANTISAKVDYLIVGSKVSPHWVTESYGRKIMKAVELRNQGHRIAIVPESKWQADLEAEFSRIVNKS